MVLTGNLSPDPSNRPDESFLATDVTMPLTTSSDSEEEDISYAGYEVLPQDFIDNNITQQCDSDSQESSNDEAHEINVCLNNLEEVSGFDQSTRSELSELWNSSESSRLTDIIIDSTKEEQIKNAMAGFRLPATAIPQWAQHIPEEEWKEQLINRVSLFNKVTSV